MRLLCVGGRQKRNAVSLDESQHFEAAVLAEVDTARDSVRLVHEYVSPREAAPDASPSFVFKAATRVGDELYVCTQTEVLIYALPGLQLAGYVSLPRFNDVHHVRPRADGTLLVASTGLDAIVHVDREGRILGEHPVLPPDRRKSFDPAVDWRKVSTTKPHASHPNYVFELDGRIWATRFEQRDAVCVEDLGQTIPIGLERPHDGIEFDGELYFSTVDGHLVMVDASTRKVSRAYDLRVLARRSLPLGWCRGIHVFSRYDVLVGFTRLRPIRIVDHLRWMAHKLVGEETRSLPTRIARFDLARGVCTAEWNLEGAGMNAVFSIHPVGGRPSGSPA
jgi:hypothetical protein